MQIRLKVSSVLFLSMLAFSSSSQAAIRPFLGTAVDFAVLGATTVTNTGSTVVTGDLGVSPGSSVTGFYPPGIVNGTIYTGVGSNAGPAQASALVAYNFSAGQACDTNLSGTDLGGLTLLPGIYCFDSSAELTGTLTLDFQGDSNAVFIFQIGSTLVTASNANVVIINGFPSCNNVIWQVGSSATLGTGTDFFGDILASESITLNTGASMEGSLYALNGAVTLDDNGVESCGLSCANDAECIDDSNVCTTELCEPGNPVSDVFGCTLANNNLPCDDNLFCSTGDVCSAGACSGVARDCVDTNICTNDSCSEAADVCVYTNNTMPCNDLAFCTVGDVCGAGICAGAARDCSDSNVCTNDSCDETGDICAHVDNAMACEDGQFCTDADLCSAGACIAGPPLDCGDGNICTNDSCDETGNICAHVDNAVACEDGQFCTDGDLCSAGACVGGPLLDCTDADVCTIDSCSEVSNICVHVNNTGPCDDGQFCTVGDACSAGGCVGVPRDCADGNACTNDSCIEATDICAHVNNAIPCEDGEFCTVDDACGGGICLGGLARDCADATACTVDACLEASDICTHVSSACGNGIVELACGEQCDVPGGEICNNGTDEDGDGDIDCADIDCIEPNPASCSEQCLLLVPCVPLLRDPAFIYLSQLDPRAVRDGNFSFHGRMVPTTDVNPSLEGFAVTLSNAGGEIFRAELPPGTLTANRKGRFLYRAPDPQAVLEEGGVRSLRVKRRKDAGLVGYGVRVRVSGDFSQASVALMTTQVYLGDDVAFVTAKWKFGNGRWTLSPSDY